MRWCGERDISYQISEIRKRTEILERCWGFAMGREEGFLTSRTPFGMTVFGLLQKAGHGIELKGGSSREGGRCEPGPHSAECDRNCEKLGRLR